MQRLRRVTESVGAWPAICLFTESRTRQKLEGFLGDFQKAGI
jgi:hypothetical protein